VYDRLVNIRYRVGFVGAGHISAFHAAALRRIPGVELVGIYDTDGERCRRAAQSTGTRAMPSFRAFRDEGVDVIHILTPPDTHAALTLAALEMGAHVLVEKPLATDVEDCRRVAETAAARGLRVCVDHSLLYDIQIRRALNCVRAGKLGRVISVDILRSADYPPYEGGPLPPQYRSAGYPFRDLGVHQLYLLKEFLGPIEDVRARWFILGGDPNLTFDVWWMDVTCRDGSGSARISFNARPLQNMIFVQGTKGTLRVDVMSMNSALRVATPLPKTIERLFNAYAESLQTALDVSGSAIGFARKSIRQYHGVQELVIDFYRTLHQGSPVPVSVEDAIPVVDWTERVARAADADCTMRKASVPRLEDQTPILVTGAAGALGSAFVDRLRSQGKHFRIFIRRRTADTPSGIEVVTGDLGDPVAVDSAVRGARIVVHIGAAMKGSWTVHNASTVIGTQNVINACLRHGVEQLIYISSLSVVNWAGERPGTPISESSPLERFADARGAYTRAKLKAESLVREACQKEKLRAVILRPGQIFGGKLPLINDAVARKVGKYRIVLGNGRLRLPLVFIDDVIDGICAAIDLRLTGGQIIQLVDGDLPSQNEILERFLDSRSRIVHIARPIVFALGWFSEILFMLLKRQSPFSRYRLRSALADRTYVSEYATTILGWHPQVGVTAGMEKSLELHSVDRDRLDPAYATNPS
jgi:2-alkyl-3-oxoalkanoate reductase